MKKLLLLLISFLPLSIFAQGVSPVVVAVSQPVVTNPINNQYVTQPAGTNLIVNNMICTGSCIGFNGGGGGGTSGVTSVGLLLPSIFTITLSPITSTGNLTAVLANESAATVFAGPCTGSATTPGFRGLCSADIPANAANTTGTAGNVTGIVAIVNGGTGTATPGLVAGTGIGVTGSWPNQTINNTLVGSGTSTQLAVYGAGNVLGGDPNITDSGTVVTISVPVYLSGLTASTFLCSSSISRIANCSTEFVLDGDASTYGTYTNGTLIKSMKVSNAGHFTNLEIANTSSASCTTAPTLNVHDLTAATAGTAKIASNTGVIGGTIVDQAQTLVFSAGDQIAIMVDTTGGTCATSVFNVTATVSEP